MSNTTRDIKSVNIIYNTYLFYCVGQPNSNKHLYISSILMHILTIAPFSHIHLIFPSNLPLSFTRMARIRRKKFLFLKAAFVIGLNPFHPSLFQAIQQPFLSGESIFKFPNSSIHKYIPGKNEKIKRKIKEFLAMFFAFFLFLFKKFLFYFCFLFGGK